MKKSCSKCGEYGSFEHLLFSFIASDNDGDDVDSNSKNISNNNDDFDDADN